jgi:hypothetical protein
MTPDGRGDMPGPGLDRLRAALRSPAEAGDLTFQQAQERAFALSLAEFYNGLIRHGVPEARAAMFTQTRIWAAMKGGDR